MYAVYWPNVILFALLFLAFPIYVVYRLQTISRKLSRIEQQLLDQKRAEIKAENARIAKSQEPPTA
ncbi:hypothetical protein NLX71_14250 [Paenibacillus sp. MZ04-78.2]|uniref:hypothetical protein n=1 Tax=Paenibacillus sp. MZ04-78.2 TaxID=2962034 RepID=UPI0020B69AE0|nr:hypothetical protein [Paenibacillus sp. MZ04-78.2]MCP3774458.1 hypothetical protein [Paenibacillus sp. MZ04-78.2]